jgi:phosphatidate cytidylyltransferase
LVGVGVLWEYSKLAFGFVTGVGGRAAWLAGGIMYIGLACFTLLMFSAPFFGMTPAILLIAGVIGTDVGAYFAGRTFGGPKIAPSISPSKTWSGLGGGMVGAGMLMMVAQLGLSWWRMSDPEQTGIYLGYSWASLTITGAALAAVAQVGDFFESWMKRRAGVKDSGRLIPGHGGLFDRTDGLIAVAFVAGLIVVFQILFNG